MAKRERFDVIHDILDAINSKTKVGPTKLIYSSNLSPKMFKEYVEELLDNGLIEEITEKNRKFYSVTEKGYIFLERYKVFKNFVDELGL